MGDYISRDQAIANLMRWQTDLALTYGKNDEYVLCLERVIEMLEGMKGVKK